MEPRQAAKIQQQSRRDFGAETIKELFDQIETVGVPDRLKRRAIEEAKAPAPAPAATPASGSTDPIERARLTVAPIKAWGKDAWIVGGNTYAYKDQLRLLGGKWNGSLKGWQFETDPTDLLREQLSSGTDTRLRRNPRTGNGLAASAVTSVVDRIRSHWRNAPPVVVVQSYLDLPAAIREAAEAQGALPGEVDGVYHKGSVYLASDNLGGRVDIERALFHEVYGHFGLRTLLGADGGRIQAKLNELYLKIGGMKGLRALAARRGFHSLIAPVRHAEGSVPPHPPGALPAVGPARQRSVRSTTMITLRIIAPSSRLPPAPSRPAASAPGASRRAGQRNRDSSHGSQEKGEKESAQPQKGRRRHRTPSFLLSPCSLLLFTNEN